MRLHYLQHVAFEDAANIAAWNRARGRPVTATRLHEHQMLPPQEDFDWLVVLGGPMSVHDETRYPWLVDEKAFIREAIDRGKLVLGVCLGAQLVAEALGARVEPNLHREIGWWPVSLTRRARRSPVVQDWPRHFRAFHWHGETFTIPPGSIRLAESPACRNQMFQHGPNVVGVQFHLEYSMESILGMIHHGAAELDGSLFVQTPEQMLARYSQVDRISRLMDGLLSAMARQAGAVAG